MTRSDEGRSVRCRYKQSACDTWPEAGHEAEAINGQPAGQRRQASIWTFPQGPGRQNQDSNIGSPVPDKGTTWTPTTAWALRCRTSSSLFHHRQRFVDLHVSVQPSGLLQVEITVAGRRANRVAWNGFFLACYSSVKLQLSLPSAVYAPCVEVVQPGLRATMVSKRNSLVLLQAYSAK